MSSETLRGIGRNSADGGATGGGSDSAANEKEPAPVAADKLGTRLSNNLGTIVEARDRNDEKTTPVATAEAKAPEAALPLRSLDSTVPGTRSLDAAVPGATPSLDARLSRLTPPLSATLIGIPMSKFAAIKAAAPAPARPEPTKAYTPPIEPARTPPAAGAGRRDHGTASGHDLHLPVELQRAAGGHSASGSGPTDGTPRVILAPGLADEITKPVAPATEPGEWVQRNADDLALGAHNPWYDQLPAAEEVYEEAKPNLVARVAVGVAAAAAAAVLVIAFMRHGRDDAPGNDVAQTPPAVTAPGARVASPLPPPGQPARVASPLPPPTPAPVAAAPAAPVDSPTPAAPAAAAPVVPPPPIAAAPNPAPVAVAPPPPPPPVAAREVPLPTPAARAEPVKPVAPKAAPLAVKTSPADGPAPPKGAAPRLVPPRPVAAAPRPSPAAPARPAVALRTEPAPAKATPPVHPVVAPARPARPAADVTAHKSPIVATASPSGPRPATRPRADVAPAPAKRPVDRSRQKLLADPDSTLPLSLE